MKRLWLAGAMASALAWAGGNVLAREAPKKPTRPAPRKRTPTLRGVQAEMLKVCGLSEDQQKQLHEINAARGKAYAEFHKANAEKIKAAAEAVKKAREAKDQAAMKEAYAAQRAIRAEQAQVGKKFDAQVLAVLTAEQKDTWETHNLKKVA